MYRYAAKYMYMYLHYSEPEVDRAWPAQLLRRKPFFSNEMA